MFAVIKTGGKQYKVKKGDKLKVEKIDNEEGKSIDFDEVLLVADKDGEDVKIGTPKVENAKVKAKIIEQGRDKKIDVIKYKRKVRYRRKYGHRQPYTEILIEDITV